VATGVLNPAAGSLAAFQLSPYVVAGTTNYGLGFSINNATGVSTEAAGTTLVTSPIATACLACHDSDFAIQHMELTGGGSIYRTRGTPNFALGKPEQCMFCHSTGAIKDIKAVHPTK
jgi:hypothetical protein